MFNKVLIANRGAIATRIIRTLKQLGVTAVSVYAEADVDSLHVSQADEAYSLGSGRAADTYLDQEKLLTIARQCGADAIHPGYGFLSENPDFVTRCEDKGICFIGPSPVQMRNFGLKHTARTLARDNDIPMLPGTELLNDAAEASVAANRIGYPVMLKSTAGGGGIGMQLCHNDDELAKAFDSVRRLGESNFANSGVFLEKFIEHARHIEVQIFGNGRGQAIALGERDCSAQRRNQKVIEECPAPNIPHNIRAQLHAAAIKLMQAVAYRNAGTVEFVYDQREDQFYFLEVNTRLQVEHGVTEQVYGVDLVAWMLMLAAGDMPALPEVPSPQGHAIQARVYAEDPNKNFQPCAGLLTDVSFPQHDKLRIDHWVSTGIEISPFFDPMLAKIIVHDDTREQARQQLDQVLAQTSLYGIETNIPYVRAVLNTAEFSEGRVITRFLNNFSYQPLSLDVLSPGTLTTIQDYPGRVGYWHVGVPPSGPFDSYSFCLGNRLLENEPGCAGLEITLNGPTLRFNTATQVVLTGATMQASLDDLPLPFWQVIDVQAGQTLRLGKISGAGARSYLLVKGGIRCPDYLGAHATFTLGQFGGHGGRALRAGDVLHLPAKHERIHSNKIIDDSLQPAISEHWTLRVIYGPHGAPDFFTQQDIDSFFAASWEVHYNSSRTGIRLIGPKPQWARSDGGEAGMHPSNIHDNAYAIGTIDFTGDMPVILGPDGPSLGGFVCPATVIAADLWKLGQLKAGNTVRFEVVSIDDAVELERAQLQTIARLSPVTHAYEAVHPTSPVLKIITETQHGVQVVYRPSGDKYLLVEYGPLVLDIALRFRVHALMLWLQRHKPAGMLELTPGIRSLQVHYDSQQLALDDLLELLDRAEYELQDIEELELPARVVHLPLSWDDTACQQAIKKYMQSVRKEAPWCPSNIEFIRRINGLDDIEAVRQIVFEASYLVMGLGDVYLGAPVATPLDPRHRLVTTKYNPARTWTAENSVGIGGSYLCIYGMEGPGGYQFVGRTLQMWNRYRKTTEFSAPWLLRFFDQIRFYQVSAEELQQIREDFPRGRYPLRIENTTFKLKDYQTFLQQQQDSISEFTTKREQAFAEELERWVRTGQINFDSAQDLASASAEEEALPQNCMAIESPVAGSVWQVLVDQGDQVKAGQPLIILESMKMEIEVTAVHDGIVYAITRPEGQQVNAGQALLILQENS
ncbi:MAG: urea carboxylase [Gammaproteobacteria bacterium]